jgi:hypothetical protein
MIPREPHPELAKLHEARRALRNVGRSQMDYAAGRRAIMRVEIEIHECTKRHGEGRYSYRRCAVCFKLHPLTVTGCDGRGSHLFELWSEISPTLF